MKKLHHSSQSVSLSEITALRQQVEKIILDHGGQPEITADMMVALDEALVNIVKHGYQGQDGLVELEIRQASSSLVIILRDAAPLFDPTTRPAPNTTLPLAQRPFGGMGIHMMRYFTDELQYQPTPNGRNQLTLIKYNTFEQPE